MSFLVCRFLFLGLCFLVPGVFVSNTNAQDQVSDQEKGVSLLTDPHFRDGFVVLNPTPGKRAVSGAIRPFDPKRKPAWALCQWNSRFDIAGAVAEKLDAGALKFGNSAKSVVFGSGSKNTDLVMSVDSNREFGGKPRNQGQAWPHLLVQQEDIPTILLGDATQIHFSIDAQLEKNEQIKMDGYSRGLHSAQFLLTLIVQDRNPKSKGFGDFLWFNITLYEEREKYSELFAAMDTAAPSAKMIYAPASRHFAKETLHDSRWVHFSHNNLGALLHDAIALSHERGFLKNSLVPDDFAITSIILGWEVTGNNQVSMRIRDFDFRVFLQK